MFSVQASLTVPVGGELRITVSWHCQRVWNREHRMDCFPFGTCHDTIIAMASNLLANYDILNLSSRNLRIGTCSTSEDFAPGFSACHEAPYRFTFAQNCLFSVHPAATFLAELEGVDRHQDAEVDADITICIGQPASHCVVATSHVHHVRRSKLAIQLVVMLTI